MWSRTLTQTALATSLSLFLVACGGGSSGGSSESSATPINTTTSGSTNTSTGSSSGSTGSTSGTSTDSTGGSTGSTGGTSTGSTGGSTGSTGGTSTGSTGGTTGSTGGTSTGTTGGSTGSTGGTSSGSTDNTGNTSTGSTSGSTGDSTTNGSTGTTDNSSLSSTENGADTSTTDVTNSTDNATNTDTTQASAPAWSAGSIYNTGDKVYFDGNIYQAKWWTQGDQPDLNSGTDMVWSLTSAGSAGTDSTDTTDNADTSADNTGTGDSNIDNSSSGNEVSSNHSRPDGKVVGTYFVEWGVYGRNYHVMDMPAEKLTHVLYGFIPVCGPNESLREANASGHSALQSQCQGKQDYEVTIHDKYAALEKTYPGDNWDDPIRGNFGQLIKLKQQQPHLKILPSVGGWTLSDPFFDLANDATKRAVFVSSVKQFLTTYSFFDGVDIDWEFPGGRGANSNLGSSADFEGYADLMRDLRAMLDELEGELGKELELTSAIGTSPVMVAAANYGRAQQYIDYIFAMTYDYNGAWNGVLGHQTALNNYSYNANDGFYAASVVDSLVAQNVPLGKIVIGAAMYGRGWKDISGAQPEWPFSGTGNGAAKGTWEAGVLDYKDIVTNYLGGTQGTGINGFQYYYDADAEAPYLWNYSTGTLITYDNPRSVKAKGAFVNMHGLGGLFSWEIDADNGDIVDAMLEGLSAQ